MRPPVCMAKEMEQGVGRSEVLQRQVQGQQAGT